MRSSSLKWRAWNCSPPDERLDPVKLMRDLQASGKPSAYLPTVDAIVEHIAGAAKSGDVISVFSNGALVDP
jgi:UDP-N-acetylmuramate-alanine ligase